MNPGESGAAYASERGSGTVLVLGLIAAAVVLMTAISLLAGAQSARGAAQAAADLGALAAAEHLASLARTGATHEEQPQSLPLQQREAAPAAGAAAGVGSTCAIAREVVAANGASLTGCVLLGGGMVRVSAVRVSALRARLAGSGGSGGYSGFGGFGAAQATARAGPESAASG